MMVERIAWTGLMERDKVVDSIDVVGCGSIVLKMRCGVKMTVPLL